MHGLTIVFFILTCFSEGISRSKVIFTYTAMHGVGYKFIVEAFKMFAFEKNFVPVKEQVGPSINYKYIGNNRSGYEILTFSQVRPFSPKESLPPGSSETWPTWSSLIASGQGLDDANPLCRNGDSTRMDRQRANVGMNRT